MVPNTGSVGRAPHLMLLTPPPERAGSSVDARQSVDDAEVEVKEESKAHVDEKAPTPLPEPKEPPSLRTQEWDQLDA